jgi:hypothetical protein
MLGSKEVYSTLDNIKNKFPNAGNNGLTWKEGGDFKENYNEDFVLQVNEACHWCRNVALKNPLRKSHSAYTSYNIKHTMEKWLKLGNSVCEDRYPYISNMAAITAFELCGISYKVVSNYCNPYTNISAKSLN